ncbi:uncharacterized protein LOC132203973 [Neocloeon triangulifer]|uniref:uncharacterized protein LOC132203973 n=1 Tax=Neocloeon triangulifer TaxID=2078957 RepID=UPI00286ED50B|nr:uncharacterized protein LOC132203973 [Neocloeon triangulifer]
MKALLWMILPVLALIDRSSGTFPFASDGNDLCFTPCTRKHANVPTCFTSPDSPVESPCSEKPNYVPLYFTEMTGSNEIPVCYSLCGKFARTDYAWCWVDEHGNWDYCNPGMWDFSIQDNRKYIAML